MGLAEAVARVGVGDGRPAARRSPARRPGPATAVDLEAVAHEIALAEGDGPLVAAVGALKAATGADLAVVHLIEREITVCRASDEPGGGLRVERRRVPPAPGSVAEELLRTRTPLVVPDTGRRERMHPQVHERGIGSTAHAPILLGDQVVGTLNACWRARGAASAERVAALVRLARALAIPLAYLRQREAAERRLREQRIVTDTIGAIAAAPGVDGALRALLEGMQALTGADGGSVRLAVARAALDPAHWSYQAYHCRDGRWWREGGTHRGTGGALARMRASGRGEYEADLAATGGEAAARLGAGSSLKVPLRAGGEIIGVLYADAAAPHAFSEELLVPLQALADHGGAAVAQARLVEAERAQMLARERETRARLASEARYRSLVQHAADIIAVVDADGVIQYVSPACQQTIGYLPEELVGRSRFLIMAPDDAPAAQEQFARLAAAPGARIPITYRARRHDGAIRDIEGVATNLLDDPGVRGIVVNVRDVTDRKRAEAALEREYQAVAVAETETPAILDATSEAMVLLSPEGRILSLNRRFEGLFGLEHDQLVGLSFEDFRPEIVRIFGDAAVFPRLAARLTDQESRHTVELRQRWPQPRDLQVYTAPVLHPDGGLFGRLFVFRDVTQERAVDRMKTEFVSLVSHELRTPLTSIKGYIDLLAAGEVGPLGAEQLEFLGIVKSNADRLVALINDLLDISRIEAGKVELKRSPVAVDALLRQVAVSFRPQLAAKGQALALEVAAGLPAALGDRDRLIQVVTNLVANAHKYTPAGGRIALRARAAGGALLVEVADSGVGMSEEELGRLFGKFFRAGNRATQEAGGTGLGLAISRSLVELHGGTIAVASRPGQGATFTVTLPLGDAAGAPAADPIAAPAGPALGGRVLVVDDERDIANLLRRYLERGGYRVDVAHSAAAALRLARQQPPDLLTLDVKLPDADGFTLLEWLRRDLATAAIPAIFLSAVADDGQAARGGALDYLVKPVQEEELLARVRRALDGRGPGAGGRGPEGQSPAPGPASGAS